MTTKDIDYKLLSPMMQHYIDTKKETQGCILFYRLGDFYELFFEDAEITSKELELTLTGKSCGLPERAPMCGVPFHAVDIYISKMVEKGYRIAICEQVEDPKTAKGIVKREVTRIVTPGTNMAESAFVDGKNNYIMCILYMDSKFGVSIADASTGAFFVTEVINVRRLYDEIAKFSPVEIICNQPFFECGINITDLRERLSITVGTIDDWYFDEATASNSLKTHFHTSSLKSLGIDSFRYGQTAAGALFTFIKNTQKTDLSHFTGITPYLSSSFMLIDAATRRNLELTETMREKKKRGSLLWVLDKTQTAMGSRYLRSMIEQPLLSKSKIEYRLEGVNELFDNVIDREEIREYLRPVYDLERLLGRISYKTANPRDLIAFKQSLKLLPSVRKILSEIFRSSIIKDIAQKLDPLSDIYELLDKSISEDAPLALKEGGIIKDGYNEMIDELRNAKTEGKDWLSALEEEDRNRTGIKNLRIKYNKVFGYYFEVTNSYKDLVPEDYIRKQTLAGAERFTTPRLKELEDKILNAEDKLTTLEYDIFCEIRDCLYQQIKRLQTTAVAIARLDALASLATVAEKYRYVKPSINEDGVIEIKQGRHPVVELLSPDGTFIDNDTLLDNNKNRVDIITGPNMAGKSTYMRQVALISLMAQIGSFVPASFANICVCDRIFTRVGASDDLASGQSTFMVEMTEVANILRNATSKSLIILDEIGRGTATFDGLSIAWAVVEHISDKKFLGAKTLFATHYHELTELEGKIKGVNNYCISVKEEGENIIFLRKIIKGGADKSYGIQVARLAGVPKEVTERAKELVDQLSDNDITSKIKDMAELKNARKKLDSMELNQLSFIETMQDDDIIREISELDISHMTPVNALITLEKLQNKAKNRV